MKKFLFLTLAMAFVANFAVAQTAEEVKASEDRIAKIVKLVKAPKDCGIYSIDELKDISQKFAVESMVITETLADAATNNISLANCVELAKSIKEQVESVTEATKQIPRVSDALKSEKNPMKLGRATSCVKYIKNALATTLEESVYQAKSVASIIETLKK